MQFVVLYIIVILFSQSSTCWSTQAIDNDGYNVYNVIEFPSNYVDESVQGLCEDDTISLNFSNAVISEINQNFISSSIITCLNLTDNNIRNIGNGAFDKLPNLNYLFLSNNRLERNELFNFGSHNKLQVLIMNEAVNPDYCFDFHKTISGEYPNLEILSLRKNCFHDLQASRFPFPKLKILDLSGNSISQPNFVEFLPNSLYYLDLHDNSLSSLDLSKRTNKLFALNLNNNRFTSIKKWLNGYSDLSVVDLKDLQYLSISENGINNIEPDAFQDNNRLLYLNLSTNHINYLRPKTFANLQYLNILDLSNNRLKGVPQILNQIKISALYINNNNIKKIISYNFVQMPKLTKLLMGKNQIDEIDVDAFASLSILEDLDLSTNMLSSLPVGWAESLVSLKHLDLSNNKFISLESLSLTSTLPIIEIYLMMNPLEYLNVKYFENLPQNLTIHLINYNSQFINVSDIDMSNE
ncbi:PREDICTED: podocan-like [Wasmannia auropunctata]|uniref:podocan-like n=1 Tax=Wasmannia auropunctata TaxID=64793 RepID=UPI0005ED67C4|nr:PREDICTED: podocan-like [Wasmannia auropunctata]